MCLFNLLGLYMKLLWPLLALGSIEKSLLHQTKESRVLILGAGVSGIAAAKKLHENGFENYVILEGSDRIGGRIKSSKIGNFTVELGAMWIYGKGTNPIYDLALKYNISFVDIFVDEWTVRDTDGKDVTTEADLLYQSLEQVMDNFDNMSKDTLRNNKQDFTVLSALRNLNWRPKTKIEDAVEAYFIDFENGAPPSALSGKHLYFNEPFDSFGNEELMIINDTDGFSSLPEHMINEFLSANDSRLRLNTYVTSIDYTKDIVKVMTNDGSVFEADYAIVTFSVGVLQQREVTFMPPLPSWKMMAIDRFGICPFVHIHLQFPHMFWDNTMYILFAAAQRGKHSVWLNMNFVHPGSNILMLSVFWEDAIRIERLEDANIIEELLNTLKTMYPVQEVPYPNDYTISRWVSDPLYRGAWSYWPPTFTYENMDELKAPVDRLYFAGEHMNKVHIGFIHSAYMSGTATASEVIKCLKSENECKTCQTVSYDVADVLRRSSGSVTLYISPFVHIALFLNIFNPLLHIDAF